jgi:hypothetical protein
MALPFTKSRCFCLSLARINIVAGSVTSGSARRANAIAFAAGCGDQPFLKQHDNFSFRPQALAEGAAVRLYDRVGGGIIARAVDLPLIIIDDSR